MKQAAGRILLLFFLVGAGTQSWSQDADDIDLDSLEFELLLADTTSLFNLIDSLLLADLEFSSLVFRLGYTSQVQTAGRTFDVYQYGLSPGITYYHKSGFYGEITGYWNSDMAPKYNLTVLTAGYMGGLGSYLNVAASYDYLWYHEGDEPEFTSSFDHSLTSSLFLDINHFIGGVDYMFLFGEEQAHRITPYLGGQIDWYDAGFLDRIGLFPSASLTLGNANIVNYRFRYSDSPFRCLRWPGLCLIEESRNEFGLMNYQLALPVSFSVDNFTLMLQYSHNFPVPLPGETVNLDNFGFFSAYLLYSIIP